VPKEKKVTEVESSWWSWCRENRTESEGRRVVVLVGWVGWGELCSRVYKCIPRHQVDIGRPPLSSRLTHFMVYTAFKLFILRLASKSAAFNLSLSVPAM
jgi:hypothetical protein